MNVRAPGEYHGTMADPIGWARTVDALVKVPKRMLGEATRLAQILDGSALRTISFVMQTEALSDSTQLFQYSYENKKQFWLFVMDKLAGHCRLICSR